MATRAKSVEQKEGPLTSGWNKAWDALSPLRATWDEKEQSLMAQTNDSVSGNITVSRVSDAALSTLAYERQARVCAQLPTGRVYAMSKPDDKKAALLNIVLNRYILPNADSQFDMLIKLRMWGVYASVYGSMPMFYDYRVDDRYIGPECYLVDPRCFAPVNGFHNVQDAGCYISTIMGLSDLQSIAKRKTTSYDKAKINELIKRLKSGDLNKPSKDNDSQKTNTTVGARYDLSGATDRIEIVTKYEHDTWTSFAPDAGKNEAGEDFIIRKMDNPHKSGRIPVVMRHCFPLLNSVFGLGDFERGMKVQKAKDSILNLFIEGAKNRVFPPLKMIDSLLTPSTIRYQAGTKWKVKQQNAVEAMTFGQAPLAEFQATFAALSSIQQNMFGTSTTEITEAQGGPSAGKTPQALKMQASRENARDTWDRFMHEKATEELLEGMLNLLTVKMEKPINFSVFEDDILALGYSPDQAEVKDANGAVLKPKAEAKKIPGLDVFDGAKSGKMSVAKKDLTSQNDIGYSYLIDANSSMKQDDEEMFAALLATWNLVHQTPGLAQGLAAKGMEYDEGDHLKAIFIAAGINDWERILKELSPEKMAQLAQQAAQAQGQQMGAQPGMPGQPQPGMPQGQPGMQPQPGPQGAMPPQVNAPQQAFNDPQIAAVAQQILGGQQQPAGAVA